MVESAQALTPNGVLRRATELMGLQRAEECEALVRESLCRFQHPELHFRLALALLMQGKLREGFAEFEGRIPRQMIIKRMTDTPEWDGQVAGRSVIVWGEQGIGDEVQAARFLPLVRQRGARHITFACHDAMVRAFQQVDADVVVSRRTDQIAVPRDACWIAIWSLPHRLGLGPEDISGAPYLKAEALPGRGGIGLVERGNPMHRNDEHRSIPQALLQRAVPHGRLLEAHGDGYDSLRQVAGLDLLITVDTSWAHMAGALGVPCWVLLPYLGSDWRWQRERSTTPWYDSLRLFRQPEPGDWATPIRQVVDALRT